MIKPVFLIVAIALLGSGCMTHARVRHHHFPRHVDHGIDGRFYHYHYYPSARVYFHAERNLYFYYSGNTWVSTSVLPLSIQVTLGIPVDIEAKGDKPWKFHKAHLDRYPPGQLKKHRYAYFPGNQVYFDSHKNRYFYRVDGKWKSVQKVPKRILGKLKNPVGLDLDADKPWIHHDEHTRAYPPAWGLHKQQWRQEQRENHQDHREDKADHRKDKRQDHREDKADHRKDKRQDHREDKAERHRDGDKDERRKDKGPEKDDKKGPKKDRGHKRY